MDLRGLPEWMLIIFPLVSTFLCVLLLWMVQAFRGPSSPSTPDDVSLRNVRKINDHVYEISTSNTPSVEIVFFHGLQWNGFAKNLHITTWLSKDKSKLWLEWLLEEIPNARILVVSYDACIKQTGHQGMIDMYRIGENLVHSFKDKGVNIGQYGCPVVLVGHCVGGLVMKQLCIQADKMLCRKRTNEQDERLQNLLWNLKGLFFYATPHHGAWLTDKTKYSPKGALFEHLNPLNTQTARINNDFRCMRNDKYAWKTFGIAESRESALGDGFTDIVVSEASARSDVDDYFTIADADHFTVCQPDSKDSSSFQRLSDFVAKVVKQDQNQLPTKMNLSAAEGVGLEARVKEISKTLQHVQRLGVVGMGGIGKTTLVKTVFDTISGRFDYTAFVYDVKISMKTGGDPKNLQTLILSKLHRKGRPVDEYFCWSTLTGKKVLIVLDDVDNQSQVKVMTESDSFSKDSRVIVTARDSRFLIAQHFSILWVQKLSLDHSIRLFCLHAFESPVAPKDYEKQVAKFAEKCDGLPLALKIAGQFLYTQSAEAWNGTFDKLQQAKSLNGSEEDGLWSVLRVSYNNLAHDEREMFLDVATCFHGVKLKDVQEAWRVCSWGSPVTGWQNLLDRGMVSEVDEEIWMHEVLRDLGWSIACPQSQNVATHTRVCDVKQLKQLLLNQEKAPVKVLRISGLDLSWEDLKNPGQKLAALGFLGGLKELQILWLDGYFADWPKSMGAEFLSEPVFLKMECCDPRDIVALGQLHGLRSIQLRLDDSDNDDSDNDYSDNDDSDNDGIDNDDSDNDGIDNDDSDNDDMDNDDSDNDDKLEHSLSFLGQFDQLEYLQLRSCSSLRELPGKFGELSALAHLELHDCWRLKTLPQEFGKLSALAHLELHTCESLTTLPQEFGKLSALAHLEFHGCRNLKTLPQEFGKLSALAHVELHGCRKLMTLPAELENLSLQHLKISEWTALVTLPAEFGKLSELQHLELGFCYKLMALPAEFEKLSQLQHLEIYSCGLETLPAEFGKLQRLCRLKFSSCALQQLPASFVQLEALELLEIKDCPDLIIRLSCLGNLRHLERLNVVYCKKIFELDGWNELVVHSSSKWTIMMHLRNLTMEELRLTRTVNCKEGGVMVRVLSSNVDGDSYDSFDEQWVYSGALAFSHSHCHSGSLATLSGGEGWGQIQALQSLKIEESGGLPGWLGECQELKELIFKDSDVSKLPATLGQLRSLKTLKLSAAPV